MIVDADHIAKSCEIFQQKDIYSLNIKLWSTIWKMLYFGIYIFGLFYYLADLKYFQCMFLFLLSYNDWYSVPPVFQRSILIEVSLS